VFPVSKDLRAITPYDAITDPALFRPWFDDESFGAWHTIGKVMSGIPLTEDWQQKVYEYIAGKQSIPTDIRQLWIMAGRRSGKSLFAAFLGVYEALFRDWSSVLTRGETGIVGVICPDRMQGRVVFNYARAFCAGIPLIQPLVKKVTAESIRFRNGIVLEIRTASYRTPRGYSIVCFIVDEADFLRDDASANPFKEILTAVKPGMATTKGLLVVISTPYARTGEFYKAHERYWGEKHNSILFLKGPTQLFNPDVDKSVIEQAFEEDAVAAASEFGSLPEGIVFRSDVEGFVDLETIQALVEPGVRELPPQHGVGYVGGVDLSGGMNESSACAIAHKDQEGIVHLDAVREWKGKHSPAAAIEEMAGLFREYGVTKVVADRYAGAFPIDEFRKYNIGVESASISKSEYFLSLLPLFNSGRVRLLDNERLIGQFAALERKPRSGGRDSVDHPPNGKDDFANAAAISIVEASSKFVRAPGDYGVSFGIDF